MFFRSTRRYNPHTGAQDWYYRLLESYRDALGDVRHRTVVSVGFVDYLSAEQLKEVAEGLNLRINGEQPLFEDPAVTLQIDLLYTKLVKEKRIDRIIGSEQKEGDWQRVDLNTLTHRDVREIGSEWLVNQAIDELGITSYLQKRLWSPEQIQRAKAHLICRTVYPASEYETVRYIKENSGVDEITGLKTEKLTHHALYEVSKALYKEKEGLEQYLSRRTNELFDFQDNIILYDLTNTYFEGAKRASNIARRGRSKEKRSDCPLVVLALVVNVEGFVKYSSIYSGNMSDPCTLEETITRLRLATTTQGKRAVVVLDAGIATEENLKMLAEKGYDYVCVKRSKLKKYAEVTSVKPVVIYDSKRREIELRRVRGENDSEYYLKVTSQAKALTESSMNASFMTRFEEGLRKIASSIERKGGVKRYDKVCERIGRLKEKYPSVHRMFTLTIKTNDKETCASISWSINQKAILEKEGEIGTYFLRTNLKEPEEELVWTIYNSIRNIESSFRCLKSDLNLRPIYHKSDEATQGHLHLGLLAYQIVNTIRHRLKAQGITSSWKEINRIMKTQKCVTTTVENDKKQRIWVRRCSEPTDKVKLIYDALGYKHAPFIRKKSVVPKTDFEKNETAKAQENTG